MKQNHPHYDQTDGGLDIRGWCGNHLPDDCRFYEHDGYRAENTPAPRLNKQRILDPEDLRTIF